MRHLIGRKGNRKLPDTIGIFNLPQRSTCPGATPWCKQYCYAKKAERQYKQTRPYRELNYKLSLQDNFVDMINKELKTCGKKFIRIHESGDFYNQKYLDKWVSIVKANPNISFTFYTKSFAFLNFNKMKRCKNVIAFASLDPTTPKDQLKKAKHWKKAFILGAYVPKNTFVCSGSCKSCDHCYVQSKLKVGFRKH